MADKTCRTCKFYQGNAVGGTCLVSYGRTRSDSTSSGYEPREVRTREKRAQDFDDSVKRRKKKKKAGKKSAKKKKAG